MTVPPWRALRGRIGVAFAGSALGAGASGQAAHAATMPPLVGPVIAKSTISDRPLVTDNTKCLLIASA